MYNVENQIKVRKFMIMPQDCLAKKLNAKHKN